jgi:hypothetical protein
VATEHDLYKTIENIGVCIEFELPKVKVPSFFLGTVGFWPPREGRYYSCRRFSFQPRLLNTELEFHVCNYSATTLGTHCEVPFIATNRVIR